MKTNPSRLPRVVKGVDDPSNPPSSSRRFQRHDSTTLTTLSQLFAVQTAISPDGSRNPSYRAQSNRLSSMFPNDAASADLPALPGHLYSRGLLEGRHSDVTVEAFGRQYKLHRIILDRAPFFESALSEPWLEASSKNIAIHPEDVDNSITQHSFEITLKRLYGCHDLAEEDQDPFALFATGCWLELPEIINSATKSILRQMNLERLGPWIRLVTSNYYGQAGDKILTSAKSMLCRDGWRMSLRHWDGVPGEVIREVVGGDGFFVESEWDRWTLVKSILDRRLKQQARLTGLVEPDNNRKIRHAPHAPTLMAVRSNAIFRKEVHAGRPIPESILPWAMLYTHPDIEPLLTLLDEDIHYMHLNFELLQLIRQAKDSLGLPVMPQRVLSSALWQQMELRQNIINAHETDYELDIKAVWAGDRPSMMNLDSPLAEGPTEKYGSDEDREISDEFSEAVQDSHTSAWNAIKGPRKYLVPSLDRNIVIGGDADPVVTFYDDSSSQEDAGRFYPPNRGTTRHQRSESPSDTLQTQIGHSPAGTPIPDGHGSPSLNYTHLPPIRFSVEFPSLKLLKENRRMYSRTVFYAGSFWSVYVMKVGSPRSREVGVYVLRMREGELEDPPIGGSGRVQGSVDERIGQLERDMILRSERRERVQPRRTAANSETLDTDRDESSSGTSDRISRNLRESSQTSSSARATTVRNLLSHSRRESGHFDDGLASVTPLSSDRLAGGDARDLLASDSGDSESSDLDTERLATASKNFHFSTLPPYVDCRNVIKAYFKIYCPSRGGRMLSIFESPPDEVNLSHSLGWNSSTLMLDESSLGLDSDLPTPRDEFDDFMKQNYTGPTGGAKPDDKLRFMVVIGVI